MNKIITIGREFGSGGRELGRRLAEKLGYQYYDKEIISKISKQTSLSEGYVNQVLEERPFNLFPITIGHSINFADAYTLREYQSVYQAQNDILKELAEKGNCVIVGRCADYILKDYKPFRIFVHADIQSRIERCISRKTEEEKFTEKQWKKHILKIDKSRARYYDFYTCQTWGDKRNYDMCINTTHTVIKEIVEILARLFQ